MRTNGSLPALLAIVAGVLLGTSCSLSEPGAPPPGPGGSGGQGPTGGSGGTAGAAGAGGQAGIGVRTAGTGGSGATGGGGTGGAGAAGADGYDWGPTGLPPAASARWVQVLGAELPAPGVWALSRARSGAELWVATYAGLARLGSDGTVRVLGVQHGLASDQIEAVEAGGDGEVYVGYGSQGHHLGRLRIAPDGTVSVTHHIIATESMGEVIDSVFRIVRDPTPGRGDHVWLGTNEILALFLGTDPILQHRHPRHPHGAAWGVAIDANGSVWEGDGFQLARLAYDQTHDFFTAPWVEKIDVFPDAPDDILDIAVATDGAVWVASLGNGLARYDPATATTERFLPPDIPSEKMISIAAGAGGEVWAGSSGHGAVRIQDGTRTFHNSSGGLGADSVRAIELGPDGTAILGTDDGVWVLPAR